MTYENIDIEREDGCQKSLSLSELNGLVHDAINDALPETYWMRAETSDVRENAASGHCYLEFIEKDESATKILAKARGIIWANTFQILKAYFEQETGRAFSSGLKVLVNVSVEFHELYGYSLTVHDIEPSYTVGDLVKKKQEIIRRLQEEGIFNLNRELELATLPQRIAVISSPTAAGYEDFVQQLINNEYGFVFYHKLFPALMQGDKTETSIIAALDKVFQYRDLFDAVVIIRGGGSASELSCFDSYDLAANCAQFPLPIITGIGHERDDSVVDLVAHTRMKTPTAVAEFLIGRMAEQADIIVDLQESICENAKNILQENKLTLQTFASRIPMFVPRLIEQQTERIKNIPKQIHNAVEILISKNINILNLNEQFLRLVAPENVLKRGYSLTIKNGKIIKRAAELSAGDAVSVKFADGEKEMITK